MKKIFLIALLVCAVSGCVSSEETARAEYNKVRLEHIDKGSVDYEQKLREIVNKYPHTAAATDIIEELNRIKQLRAEKSGSENKDVSKKVSKANSTEEPGDKHKAFVQEFQKRLQSDRAKNMNMLRYD